MYTIAATAGAALYKRAAASGEDGVGDGPKQVSGLVALVFLLNFIVFLPVWAYLSYTLGKLLPALAIVENIDPPAYEPVGLNEDPTDPNAIKTDNRAGQPITSSLRATARLLYSVAGWRASFRGLGVFLVYNIAVFWFAGFFANVLAFGFILLAKLALVQLSTAWVHIVISPPNPARFWHRLPRFGKTFQAVWLPTVAASVGSIVTRSVPGLTAHLLRLPLYDPSSPNDVPEYDSSAFWKLSVIFLVSLLAWALFVVPAEVLLIRVQASLLPPDEDTIIPFDRTYNGTLEPAIVGKGYVSVKDALNTFPRSSWVRIYILHAKIFGVILGAYALMAAILAPQAYLLK